MNWLTILKSLATIFGFAASIYAFLKFIDSRIRKVIREPDFLKEVSSYLRPYAIFDEKERVLVDRGEMKFIEEIEVEMGENSELPKKIVIRPNQYLQTAPILTPLDTDISTIKEAGTVKFFV